jgi:hypothetical protein
VHGYTILVQALEDLQYKEGVKQQAREQYAKHKPIDRSSDCPVGGANEIAVQPTETAKTSNARMDGRNYLTDGRIIQEPSTRLTSRLNGAINRPND